jgi:hypothetical protein
MTKTTSYSVDDEFGNQITTGLESYDAAKQSARRYLAAHSDAPSVLVYSDAGESWDIARSGEVV